MTPKPTILYTTPVLKHPAIGGPALRVENSIKALSQISELHVYGRVSHAQLGGDEALQFYQAHCRNFYLPSPNASKRILNFLDRAANHAARKIVKRNVFSIDKDNIAQDNIRSWQRVISLADSIKADLIWLGYGNISYPLLKYIKAHSNYKVIVDTDSVWSRYILRGLPFAENAGERREIEKSGKDKEEEEEWGTRLADITTAVSLIDADYYRGLTTDPGKVCLFSNVIDMENYANIPPPPNNLKKPCIFLAGSFFGSRCPMNDAARWMIDNVLPLVQRKLPDVHFYIVGIGSRETLSDVVNPSITITGELLSVLPYLCHANVAVVPLRFESGTRFKILEAGACGIPVVSTTLGAEGLAVTHEKDIFIADDPDSFAAAIIRLIEDQAIASKLGSNLKSSVVSDHGLPKLKNEGHLILQQICGSEVMGSG